MDGFGSLHDFIGDYTVISHCGGHTGIVNGSRQLLSDQDNAAVRALQNNLKYNIPVVLIIGSKCRAPFVVPHRYCVLGWFRISHMWQEGYAHTWWKVRFESLEDGWWQRSERVPAQIEIKECPSCSCVSPVIYTVEMCFNTHCRYFFRGGGVIKVNGSAINAVTRTEIPFELTPQNTVSSDVSRNFWRGWWCQCGKLNCRTRLNTRTCSACGVSVQERPSIQTIAQLRSPYAPAYSGPPLFFNTSQIDPSVSIRDGLRILQYDLKSGSVIHIKSLQVDELLIQYQSQDIDFRRRPMKTKTDNNFLCNQFTHNAGAEYKFHVRTTTQPLSDCPPAITNALVLVTRTVNKIIECSFNELLSVMYLEGQKMSWHDDGEVGVGPVIASLSLGSTAYMKFRRKGQGAMMNLQLEHGDIVVMTGSLQSGYEHCIQPTGFRIAATARYIT